MRKSFLSLALLAVTAPAAALPASPSVICRAMLNETPAVALPVGAMAAVRARVSAAVSPPPPSVYTTTNFGR